MLSHHAIPILTPSWLLYIIAKLHWISNYITSFKSMTMFYGTGNSPWNIPIFSLNVGNPPWNIVSFTYYCYEFKQCYVYTLRHTKILFTTMTHIVSISFWLLSVSISTTLKILYSVAHIIHLWPTSIFATIICDCRTINP